MGEDVPLEITCCCAGKFALFAMIRLFSRVSEHMGSKTTSSIARELAL